MAVFHIYYSVLSKAKSAIKSIILSFNELFLDCAKTIILIYLNNIAKYVSLKIYTPHYIGRILS